MYEIYDFDSIEVETQTIGIYWFYNSKYFYVGQSKNIRKRGKAHVNKCIQNKHQNAFVQNVYNKYSNSDPYKFQILEICVESELTKQETFWIEKQKETGRICMNIREPLDSVFREKNKRARLIYQFTSSGELVGVWKGIPTASINTKVSESLISSCLQKRSKHGGGFIWSYNEDINLEDYAIYKKGDEGYISRHTKKVVQFSIKGDFIKEWDSIIEAAEQLHIDDGAIVHVCKRELGSSGGYIWRYTHDTVTEEDLKLVRKSSSCCKYDRTGKLIEKFNSCKEAAKEWNVPYQTIHACCKNRTTYKGFLYLYEEDFPTIDDLWYLYCGKNTPVIQILTDGTERLFESCTHASKELNLGKSGIMSCMTGHTKTAHGYKWRRATKEDWLKLKYDICQS